MMKNLLLILAGMLAFAGIAVSQPPVPGYHITDTLLLGGDGGWDYLTVDTASERVYISRGARVQVVDLSKNSIIAEIPKTPGVHGIALVTRLGKGYISNGRDSSVTVFDLATLKTLRTIRLDARNPDAIIFDAYSNCVFTFNGGSSNASAINVDLDSVVGTVPLSGKPEFAVSSGDGRIWVNIEDKSLITEFDSRNLNVLRSIPLAPGEEPSGLAIDRKNHRLFSGCSNKLVVVVDPDSGIVVTTIPIGRGVDAAVFDRADQLLFSSNGEGTLTVAHEDDPDHYTVLENARTRRGARTMAYDPRTRKVYTVTGRYGESPPPPPGGAPQRPPIVPGSVVLLTLSPRANSR